MTAAPAGDNPDLTEFLLARVAEDERAAAVESDLRGDDPYWTSEDAENWERHMTPARVLAECEARRRIMQWCEDRTDRIADEEPEPHDVLRLLALPYADHPDYRSEWRP